MPDQSAKPLSYYGTAYNLSYQLDACEQAQAKVGLSGKRVLEVGGSLPRELVKDYYGASQWVCIEQEEYYQVFNAGVPGGKARAWGALSDVQDPAALGDYAVVLGSIEDLPPALYGAFDVVFSVAAFEHIHKFGLALEKMAAALTPDGRLFSFFAPIWSSFRGHHLPEITDSNGQVFSFKNDSLPPWIHLRMRPPQLYAWLLQQTDSQTAGQIVYYMYHSSLINRLFVEDYARYFAASPFTGDLSCEYEQHVPPDLQQKLESLHPGYKIFSPIGLQAVMRLRAP
ncbi:hypothetical protein GCM10027396_18550 [Insolitispirillum peregrinum]